MIYLRVGLIGDASEIGLIHPLTDKFPDSWMELDGTFWYEYMTNKIKSGRDTNNLT